MKIFKMGTSPHIRTKQTVDDIMYDVILALLPALLAATYFFGIRAIIVTSISILSCMITEYICQKILKQNIQIFDGSAVLTGILYAFCIPVNMSLIYVVIGAIVSITLGKMVFGGLGQNIFNPALVGRMFVTASWPVAVTTFVYDGVGGATVLSALKNSSSVEGALIGEGSLILNTFIGKIGGSLGETSAIALLLGGLYLIYKKIIDWKVPAIMIGVVFIAAVIAGQNPVVHIFSGGLFLGAFFMATDMVTSPHTAKGNMIFAMGIGVLASLIRFKGGYPEGVGYSILIMNGFVPLIDRYVRPLKFGGVKKNDKK